MSLTIISVIKTIISVDIYDGVRLVGTVNASFEGGILKEGFLIPLCTRFVQQFTPLGWKYIKEGHVILEHLIKLIKNALIRQNIRKDIDLTHEFNSEN